MAIVKLSPFAQMPIADSPHETDSVNGEVLSMTSLLDQRIMRASGDVQFGAGTAQRLTFGYDGYTQMVITQFSVAVPWLMDRMQEGNVEAVFALVLDGNDRVVGSYRPERLTGYDGNDTLAAGAGGDTMLGGAGNDTYYADDFLDDVIELSSTGRDSGGLDRVFSTVHFVLPDYVENLFLGGTLSAGTRGYGNGLDNRIEGDLGGNFLVGGAGDDTMLGGEGFDHLIAEVGNDSLAGGSGHDTLAAGDGADALDGGAGNDTMLGGAGADFLRGGDGKDTLEGGDGSDTLAGGLGRDIFEFGLQQVGNVYARDVIRDFTPSAGGVSGDVIDLGGLLGIGRFIGSAAFSEDATDQVRTIYNAELDFTLVLVSFDSDREAEFSLRLVGVRSLSADDFLM